ncbi:thermonuclease family protein [Saccharomonospora azurea]|uniref:thermonuclease family protein n=1 Tax=Saccharomonospora azurea TaxID=40988 RepID=UPI003D8B4B69
MIDFLLVIVLIGVPVALFVKRRWLAQLADRKVFLAVVGVAWVLVIGVLARAADTDAMQNLAQDGGSDAKADADTGDSPAAGSGSGAGDGVGVHRVLSGDTLILADARRVRVLGIDAPDRGEPCFAESRDELKRLIGSAPVTLTADPSRPDIDPSGYLLRYVEETHFVDGDVSVQQARAGMAHYDAGEPARTGHGHPRSGGPGVRARDRHLGRPALRRGVVGHGDILPDDRTRTRTRTEPRAEAPTETRPQARPGS